MSLFRIIRVKTDIAYNKNALYLVIGTGLILGYFIFITQ